MLNLLRALIPAPILDIYHRTLAWLAAVVYRHPSRELILVGVTGTNGKTTTSYYIAKALEASGFQTGCSTTAIVKVGVREWLNTTKMTMPGRFALQRLLRQMVQAGCRYAVIETSSQGLIQHRHEGLAYDVAVFTNLTPEHIEAHGGFEAYRAAKRRLFEHLVTLPSKKLGGVVVPRVAVLNAESSEAAFYASTPGLADVRWYGLGSAQGLNATEVALDGRGSTFTVSDVRVCLRQPGRYNVENAMAALATCQALGVDLAGAAERLGSIERVPGRFDRVEEGQSWTVIVDQAPEPESFRKLYEALSFIQRKKVIHILGSCGGGRDVARRPILGRLAAERADMVIVTNEDPYDDDPMEIIEQVARGAEEGGKVRDRDLFTVLDRKEAMKKAMSFAQEGDLVVMTGKGCEAWMCVANGKKLPWDEVGFAREAIRAELQRRS
jgi:UDP-N-acetylmuramoyl-L-alanyl-D-glutamate--2,6-diaminopimelate ligase